MMALTIDNPQVESYFSNSIDKLKEFLETFVKDENELFEQNKTYLKKELQEIEDGTAIMLSEDEFNDAMDKVLDEYENRA